MHWGFQKKKKRKKKNPWSTIEILQCVCVWNTQYVLAIGQKYVRNIYIFWISVLTKRDLFFIFGGACKGNGVSCKLQSLDEMVNISHPVCHHCELLQSIPIYKIRITIEHVSLGLNKQRTENTQGFSGIWWHHLPLLIRTSYHPKIESTSITFLCIQQSDGIPDKRNFGHLCKSCNADECSSMRNFLFLLIWLKHSCL